MDTGTIEQAVTVAAGGAAINIGQIGQVSNYRVVADSHFYELDPDQLEEEPTVDSPRAEELTVLLAETRLLILGGELEDKTECARRIACRLRRRLAAGSCVSIRERCRGKDPQRIETAFGEGTTILLLTEISQSLIAGYGPVKLRRLLLEKRGYAIITTDCTRRQWEIADGTPEARLWQDLSWETYYGRDRLAGYLEQRFFGSDLPIPAGLLTEEPEGEWRVGGVPFHQAAATLKTPGRIRAFVTSLAETAASGESETGLTAEDVEAKLGELAGDAAAIRQWYLQFEERDQLLVVGLVLLDGLPDDLLFAGLEILVETTWRETDPLFRQFDYRDLGRFAAYFKQTPVDGGFLRIESGSRQRRADILRVAWNHQRRRLLATLPALIEMIRASAGEPAARGAGEKPAAGSDPAPVSAARLAAERALNRTKSGSIQLHQVVVESLSLIGLLSVEVVEPFLLDLAASSTENLQLLVAQALAVWREADREEEFFSLLRRWWAESSDVGNADSAIAQASSLSPDPWAAVRATLALTVGFAAQYDRENRLARELLGLLELLVDDPHPRVRAAVLKHALPRTVAWHLRQLDPFLRRQVLLSEDFVRAVARGVAEACEMRPQEGLPIVEAWWDEARADSRHASPRAPGRREILLATVARSYGYIRGTEGAMSPPALVGNLRSILREEGHPFVRQHALRAVESQTRNDLDLAAQLLPDLLTRLTFADRPHVASLALRSYLHQRQHLKGGDRKLELDGLGYAVWTERERPLTGIEATLYGWLLDRTRPAAQQLAVDAFAVFAASPLEREEKRLLRDRPRAEAEEKGGAAAATAEPDIRRLGSLGNLAVDLATLRRGDLRPLLRPLMAEVIVASHGPKSQAQKLLNEARRWGSRWWKRQAAATGGQEEGGAVQEWGSPERSAVLVERWGGVRNESAQALATHLRRALKLYRWLWWMVLALPFLGARLPAMLTERVERLAEESVPAPEVLEDWMAPLPPGLPAAEPLRFPYLLPCVRFTPTLQELRASREIQELTGAGPEVADLTPMAPLPWRWETGDQVRFWDDRANSERDLDDSDDPPAAPLEAPSVPASMGSSLGSSMSPGPWSFRSGLSANPARPPAIPAVPAASAMAGSRAAAGHRQRRRNEKDERWVPLRPFVLGELAAPLPPLSLQNLHYLRDRLKTLKRGSIPSGIPHDTPMERAWQWRKNILLTP